MLKPFLVSCQRDLVRNCVQCVNEVITCHVIYKTDFIGYVSVCVCVCVIIICVVPFKVELVVTEEGITTALKEKQENSFLGFSSLGLEDLKGNMFV